MQTFDLMGLKPEILKAIGELGFVKPTPIQEEVIPIVFETGSDIVGLAQTGTGKTAAFGLPIIQTINVESKHVQALVLAPTRELCIQIAKDLTNYSKYIDGLKIVSVYGGASIDNQIRDLKRGAHVICATPGRMLDLIKRGYAHIEHLALVVLDEADEMLNMGFRDELDAILQETPSTKRALLFSATMPNEVARIASNYMNDPVKVTIGKQNSGAENVTHAYYQVHSHNRYLALKRIVDINPNIYGIVFCRTRSETKEVADHLMKDGYNADALHGDLSQAQRDYVMNRFRDRSLQMLVATDVAARGIDVNDITHVINYNLPEDVEVYTHRSGRTGRAGKTGCSIAIVNYRERSKISQIERILKQTFHKHQVPSGVEICKKQLFHLIDRMQNVAVDEEQIAVFMDVVNKKLEHLDKEQLIKQFVSLEFNRFLEYYKNADDLNEKESDKGDRKGRERNRDRDRGDREGGESFGERRGGRSEKGYTRCFINVGKKDKISPKNIIGMINDFTHDRDIKIGAIELKDTFSFFEVEDAAAEKVVRAFQNAKYNDRTVRVEVAGDAPRGDREESQSDRGGERREYRSDRSDRPRGDRSERSDRPRSDRSDRPRSDRGERSDRPRSSGDRSDRPRSTGERSDRPRSDRGDRAERPRSSGERSDRPRSESRSSRPDGEKRKRTPRKDY